jgi:hypothetical protein
MLLSLQEKRGYQSMESSHKIHFEHVSRENMNARQRSDE